MTVIVSSAQGRPWKSGRGCEAGDRRQRQADDMIGREEEHFPHKGKANDSDVTPTAT
jgi:hypothetical protein